MTLIRKARTGVALVLGGIAGLGVMAAAAPSHAAPWIEPGDVTLRSDIEILARYGIIPDLTTTWPIPWAQIADGVNAASGRELPNYVRMAIDRVRARMPASANAQHVELEARYTNKPSVVRDFSEQNRAKLFSQAAADMQFGSTYIKLNIGYEGTRHHGVALPDGSYIAQGIGNWVVYGGYVPRWWGAGWDTSLFLSTNARDIPSVGIKRQKAEPFGTKLLSWLGPWTFDFYVGELNDPRYITHTAFINMRFAFNPLKNLEIGLARVIMTCGSGRPCSASSLFKSFIGAGEHPTGGGTVDLGNQIAEIDIKYSRRLSDMVGATVYMHLIGEDSYGPIPEKIARLFGASFDGPLGTYGGRWRIITEFSDSASSNFVVYGTQPYNVIYEHHIYHSGYRYYGRSIGDSLDNDSRLFTLTGRLWDGDSRMLYLTYRYVQLNRDGTCAMLPGGGGCAGGVSVNPENIHMLEVGVELPTKLGTFDLDGRLQSDQPNTPGVHDSAAAIEFGWKLRL
jgi:hypothetical protein